MESAVIRKPTRPQSAQDWESRKDIIKGLYASHSLDDLMNIMETEHFFKATVNQYKKQFKKWDLDHKRLKRAELVYMIAKKRKREQEVPGKDTRFRLQGKEIDDSKIARSQKRLKIGEEDEVPDVVTPPGLACFTPQSHGDSPAPSPANCSATWLALRSMTCFEYTKYDFPIVWFKAASTTQEAYNPFPRFTLIIPEMRYDFRDFARFHKSYSPGVSGVTGQICCRLKLSSFLTVHDDVKQAMYLLLQMRLNRILSPPSTLWDHSLFYLDKEQLPARFGDLKVFDVSTNEHWGKFAVKWTIVVSRDILDLLKERDIVFPEDRPPMWIHFQGSLNEGAASLAAS